MVGRKSPWFNLFVTVCLWLSFPCVYGQQEQMWMFGDAAGLDFNNMPPSPLYSALDTREGSATICDQNGALLFYTDGAVVYDRNHNLMPNSINLTGLGLHVTRSTTQGAAIIPLPGSQTKFYVFSLCAMEYPGNGRLYYSMVDMSLNDGLGDVVAGQKGILVDTGLTEQMTTVTAGTGCGVWLLVVSKNSYTLKAYFVSMGGIATTPVVSPGIPPPGSGSYSTISSLAVAPDGDKLASTYNGTTLLDFDRITGQASNPVQLSAESPYMCCFSPDGSKLYVSGLKQFDLSSGVPEVMAASAVQLGQGWGLKLGPDDVIYVSNDEEASLNAILQPNFPGLACQYQEAVVSLLPGSWTRLGLPNVISVAVPDTNYSVQAIEPGCFMSDGTLTANDASGWQYLWDNGDTSQTRAISGDGTYWVGYLTPCTYQVDTFHVAFPHGVLPTITTLAACKDASNGSAYATTYSGDPVNYAYTWLSGNDTLSVTDTLRDVPSGGYSLHVLTDTGCDTLLFFTIPEVDYGVSFTSSDTLLCQGGSVQFQNTSEGHFTEFAWYFGDGDSSLATTPPDHTYPYAGSYEVLLAGIGPICADTARQTLIVDSAFSTRFRMDQAEICAGDFIHFRLEEADVSFIDLHWDWGDGSYLNSVYDNSFYHAFDQPGAMPVQVRLSSRACPDTSFTDTVQVYVLPQLSLGGDTSLCLDGHPITLRNLAEAPQEAHHYLWNTGDTTASLRVLQPGSYSLRVSTEPLGCATTDVIEVAKDCYTDIPNAFTPNGDGDNDYFFPRTLLSKSVTEFKMQVFNRWGQLVFETTRIDGRGWDGRFNDKQQPLGVYIYLIDVGYSNGRQEQYKGNVTLIR